ncbi:MAG: acryloyl-CoA reductase [Psittacicella sp.]
MKALYIEKDDSYSVKLKNINIEDITKYQDPTDFLQIKVLYSTINYKDALAITNKGKIIRNFPLVPGVDFIGSIRQSCNEKFPIDKNILVTGFGYGEKYFGGLSEYTFVKPEHAVLLPETLDPKKIISLGTAGFTAMLCVDKITNYLKPENGTILVTGSTGGVGSLTIHLLSKLGYKVAAITGKANQEKILQNLGAKEVISREEFNSNYRTLDKASYAGAIDVLGGKTLSTILSRINYNGHSVICGLAEDFKLETTVMPFILRGVTLHGVDSVSYPVEQRLNIWEKYLNLIDESYYENLITEISLENVIEASEKIISASKVGRYIVKL